MRSRPMTRADSEPPRTRPVARRSSPRRRRSSKLHEPVSRFPVFRDAVGQTLAEHSNAVEYGLDQAKNYSARLGKAVEEWVSKDLDGRATCN